MKQALSLMVLLLSAEVWADCELHLKTLRDEMNAGQYSLDVRRKVNARLQPLTQQRADLKPLSDAECQREMQAARDIMLAKDVKMAKK
jgi:hypothetical protein